MVLQKPDDGERFNPRTSAPKTDNSFGNNMADKASQEDDSFVYRD